MSDIPTNALLSLSLDLAKSLSSQDRFDRLLSTIRKVIRCDAITLLRLHGDILIPLAQQGLSEETLGRRFVVAQHPRFVEICQSQEPIRFSADCHLPDPYDGLLIDSDDDLPMHACMGLPLRYDDNLIGVVTFDSLTTGVFDNIASKTLALLSAISAAHLNTALMIELMEQNVAMSQQAVVEMSYQQTNALGYEMIGQSEPMQQLKQEIALVATSDFTVLITGETGCGKELVADAVHKASRRAQAPIVHVNCAAIPENLIESELFGHAKGAFTGAERERRGKFSIASGGTLFLDEVGELPYSAQSKILRALQNQEIQPVGKELAEKVDVRVIAATNRDLLKEVEAGNFRADLYHRLSVYPISVPPLRQRYGDVTLLAGFFLEKVRRTLGIKQLKIAESLLAQMQNYQWPGNVRELEHVMSRAALKASARQVSKQTVEIESQDCYEILTASSNHIVPPSKVAPPDTNMSFDTGLKVATESYQRQMIRQALQTSNGNWAAASRILKMDRANLARLAKRLDVYTSA
ncbi:nitric oxide reductase transcriptional regulator NorR [Thalassotalea fusca]